VKRTANAKDRESRLLIISNRLPVVLQKLKSGRWKAVPGSGGLVTALAPVLRDRGGLWIGWPGIAKRSSSQLDRILTRFNRNAGFTLKPVPLSEEEREKYYCGFSNEISWPLFHDFAARCNFDPSYWSSYETVNRKFAKVITDYLERNDYIWVHDYHLMNVAKELRLLGIKQDIGFFLHIPFPPLDTFMRLPWRFQLLRSLLEYDLIGFQTLRDRRNFVHCVRTLVKDVQIKGKGQVVAVNSGNRHLRAGAFPISIDFNEFADLARSEQVADRARGIQQQLPGSHILLGVDRLDYTKGIIERLQAFRNALLRYPDLRQKVVLVQVVVPSREDITKYHELKIDIERLVGAINGQFTDAGWVPIHYLFRSLDRAELVAYYRTAEMALVTPFKDGMNLIAKEYCASSLDENAVLILSEFAGAAAQLQKGALLVNPHDTEGVADAIYQAFNMTRDERRKRMKKLRKTTKKRDIYWWVDSFLQAAIHKGLQHFPIIEDYMPQLEIT
jgi:trehalose 6-phosphate synthase